MKFRKTSPLLSTSLKFPVMSFQGVMYEISRIELNEAPYENQKKAREEETKNLTVRGPQQDFEAI